MTRTHSDCDSRAETEQVSDAFLRYPELQRASSSTTVSWADNDEEEDDSAEEDYRCTNENEEQNFYFALWHLCKNVASSLFSFLVAGGWAAECILLAITAMADLPKYVAAWPPALTLLAFLTIVAIVLQPDGYTWILFHQAG
jgi:hypothetical protein